MAKLSISPQRRFTALSAAITSAVANQSGSTFDGMHGATRATVQGRYTSDTGGDAVTVFLMTSVDSGSNWIDTVSFMWSGVESGSKVVTLSSTGLTTVVTPNSGALADNSIQDGILGERFKAVYTSSGTATGGVLTVNVVTKG